VQDAYTDVETVQSATIYLPAALWGEKTGVFTNTERRVNLVRKVVAPPGKAKSDLWIFTHLAKRFDRAKEIQFAETPSEVFDEIREISKGRLCDYSGMTHEKIEAARGIQWPCNTDNEAGSARLYTNGHFQYPDGKAKLIALPFVDNNEVPCQEYPFWLNSGRVVEHWHTRTKTGKIGNLNKFSPTPFMEMSPRTAAKMGIAAMDYVRVISRRSSTIVLVQLTERVAEDAVFIPMHYYNCVNRLVKGLLDPYSRQPAYKQSAVRIECLMDQDEAAKIAAGLRDY
ncbi:MAG: molybdopterin dinucleotide binding domain-containing protein, partial [Nitrospirota bacterium]|nr:molybdopterin dinucleotide binding domain-containing protein [Nitrospirota bacterium]